MKKKPAEIILIKAFQIKEIANKNLRRVNPWMCKRIIRFYGVMLNELHRRVLFLYHPSENKMLIRNVGFQFVCVSVCTVTGNSEFCHLTAGNGKID